MIPIPSMAGELGGPVAPPEVTIAFVGGSTRQQFTSSMSVSQPTGIQVDDVGLIAYRGGGSITAPAGWTQVTTGVYWKRYGTTEASVVLANSSSQSMAAVLAVFRGVHPTSAVDAFTTRTTSSGTNFQSNAVTATQPRTMLVSSLRASVSSGSLTATGPAGMTLVGTAGTGTYRVGLAYAAGPASGVASGTPAWTGSADSFSAVHALTLLRPSDT